MQLSFAGSSAGYNVLSGSARDMRQTERRGWRGKEALRCKTNAGPMKVHMCRGFGGSGRKKMVSQGWVGVVLGVEGKEQTMKDRDDWRRTFSRRLTPERVRIVRPCTA